MCDAQIWYTGKIEMVIIRKFIRLWSGKPASLGHTRTRHDMPLQFPIAQFLLFLAILSHQIN